MKRAFDLLFGCLGLVLLSPFFVAIAILVKLFSKGPAFFAHERVGLKGRLFRMVKFRSMVVDQGPANSQITVAGDLRITPIGRFLRSTKLDELPQLWNVVCGDMSLVGPRPEVMKYVRDYSVEQRRVLDLRPGITDPASFAFFNESELLAQAPDPEKYYRGFLLGEKIRINLEYAARATLWTDFILILATLSRALGIKINVFGWLQIREPEMERGL